MSCATVVDVAGFGWQYPLPQRPWTEVRAFLADVDWRGARPYPIEIVDSVLSTGADSLLAITTSMYDLVVAPRPADHPPLDVIVVCAPGSVRTHPGGTVRIDFQTVIGKHTEIVRPEDEALSLFWTFVETEFGIRPADGPGTTAP